MDQPFDRDAAHQTSHRALPLVLGIAAFFGLLAALCAPLAPLFDPDEGYYPATAAETLRSGSFWDLRFNDAPRWDKPILSYALIEGAFWLVGETATAARLPSALEGAGLIAIVGLVATRLAGNRAGVLCAIVVGSTLGVGIFSRAAHPEIAVVASVVTTELLLCMWLSTDDRTIRRRAALGSGVAIALGVLAKGPVAIVLPALALFGLASAGRLSHENARRLALDAALSLGLAALIAAPWFAAMTTRHGITFLHEAVWQQNVGRYTTTSYGHTAGALAFLLSALVGLFPWLALLPQAIRHVRLRPLGSRELLGTGMCVSALSALAFYSISSSKLPSYALVAVPALGIVVGLWLDDMFDHPPELRLAWIQCASLFACLGIVLLTSPLWIGAVVHPRQLFGGNRPPESDTGALLAPMTMPMGWVLLAGATALTIGRQTTSRTLTTAVIGAIVPVVALIAAAPTLREMYPWEAIGKQVDGRYGPLWLMGRRAPSLTFYAHAPVRVAADAQTLEREIHRQPHCWLVVTREEWPRLSENLSDVDGSIVERRGRMVLVRLAPAK